MRLLTPLFLCLALLPAVLPAQENPLETLNTEAYLKVMDADGLAASGKNAEALELYRAALADYEKIRATDATFKTRVVEYRLETLREKIAALAPKAGTTATPAPSPAAATPTPAEEDFKKLYLETREKMARDAARLLELERRNIEMTVSLRERDESLAALRTEVQGLRRDLDAARADANRLNAQLQKEVQDLRRFNNLLQERADRLEVSEKELTGQRDRYMAEVEELREERDELKSRAEHLSAQLESVRGLSNSLAERFNALEEEYLKRTEASKRELEASAAQVAALESRLKEMARLEEGAVELNRRLEEQTARMRELEKERDEKVQELAAATESSTNRINSLKNTLADVEAKARELESGLATATEALQTERAARAREREEIARQLKVFGESLNEITLLRQMLADRDNRLREEAARAEAERQRLLERIRELEASPARPAPEPAP